uniref:C-type lectin domain-containing protein n=1 Tax=Monopterus albus TaxID=43700 RepID=A0A3Q3IHG7_MONAL
MTTGIFAGLWDVISCSNKEKYICKKLAEGAATTTAPPTTLALSCASGWTPAAQRNICYKNWQDARTYCINQGGNLVSIASETEQGEQQVANMLGYSEDLWIGMNDVNWEMHFVWTDGKGISYTNWAKGHPPKNNYGCVYIDVDRTWKTAPCTNNYYSLCKRSPGETVPLLVLQTS